MGIKAYHYTNERAFKSMQTKGIDGYHCLSYDDFIGIIPKKRFIRLDYCVKLPDEAHAGVIEGLLEPEPESWTNNGSYPHVWWYLMHDICREDKVILLSFELDPLDQAYVAERAHIEDELYRELKGQSKSTNKSMNHASQNYWNSRVLVFDYDGSYSLPQLAIWSGISFDRLSVEWVKSTEDVWKRVLKNNW